MTKYPPPLALGALFDADFYLSQCGSDPDALKDPLEHFTTKGWLEGFDPHPLFSVRYYLYQRQDVLRARVNPLLHYMAHATSQDIDPHPLFDTKYYKAYNPGIEEIPLLHYVAGGHKTASPHPLFDQAFYREQVLMTGETGLDDQTPPLIHYVLHGVKKNLSPHPLFCALFYSSERPDVVEKSMNPLVHYVQFGCLENAKPHPLFDTAYFARQSGIDLARFPNPLVAFLNLGAHESSPHKLFDIMYYRTQLKARGIPELNEHPIVHYLREGHTKGLNPHTLFDSAFYVTNNPYLLQYHVEPLTHYVAWGVSEARNPHPFFDTEWYRLSYPEKQRPGITPLEAYIDDWESGGESDPCWALSTRHYLQQRPACRTANVTPPFHYYSYCRLALTVQDESLAFPSTAFAELYGQLNSRVGVKRTAAPVRVIVTSHDASRTGAPLIALNIARGLKEKYDVECIVILARGGPLEEDFAKVGTVINIDKLQKEQGINNFAPHIVALIKPSRTMALVNSIECADILRLLASMGVPCYSLVHEFTERYNEFNVKSVLENSRLVAFPSEIVKRDAIVHHSRITDKAPNTLVIPQGLNDPSFLEGCREKDRAEVCKELGIPEDCTLILGVGYIQSRKGSDLFVVAAQQFIRRNPDRKVAFVWIGDSNKSGVLYEDWVHSDIYRAGLTDKVFFVGPREDTRRYFYASDIYLHLARLDPFPCVVLEAMAARLPVILFDEVIGSIEAVGDDAGIAVPFLDMLGVHEALTKLIDDPEARASMGQCGRERIERSFSFSEYIDILLRHVCEDRGWRQIGRFRHSSSNVRCSPTSLPPVYFGASSWNIRGTNVLWRHVVNGLRDLGWDARVLFTDRLAMGEQFNEPQIAHSRVLHALRNNIQERWSALQNFLMQQDRSIFVAGDDSTTNCIVPALPSHIGVVGTLLGGTGEDYEQSYRLGLYCNKIVSLNEDLTTTMCKYNPGLLDRMRTIPSHGVDRTSPLAWRAGRRPGAPLQILFVAGPTSHEQYVTHCRDLLSQLDLSGFPYGISLLADESTTSLCKRLGKSFEDKVRRGIARVLSHGDPSQLTKLLEEHDTLVVTPDFGASAPTLTTSLAHGCVPVVVRPVCDVSHIVRSGENGIVIEDCDWTKVAKALHEIYSDMPMAIRLQQMALETRHNAYTVADMIAEYDKVLREVSGEIANGSWERPQPFVWSPHFGDALPPQNIIYPHEAL
jgi:glycosyltransferase involved in cell wall biosynthesis